MNVKATKTTATQDDVRALAWGKSLTIDTLLGHSPKPATEATEMPCEHNVGRRCIQGIAQQLLRVSALRVSV